MAKQNPAQAQEVIWENFRKRAEDLQTRSQSIRNVSDAEKARIFKTRAQSLSQEKGQTVGDQDLLHLIAFYVADEFFGIEVKYLQEVYETSEVTKIPCTPDVLVGLMNYRGTVLTLIDLSILLDLRRHAQGNEISASSDEGYQQVLGAEKVLVVEHAGVKAGLLIQKLDNLLELPKDSIHPVSSFFQDKNQIVRWEAKLQNRPLLVIDPEEMLNDEQLIVNEDVS